MLYCIYIKVPANTPPDNPVVKEVVIEEPYLTRIDVYFPPGVACLTRVAFFYGEQQIFPASEYEWLTGHAYMIGGEVDFSPGEKPWKLRIKAYNLDRKYDHTVYIYIHTSWLSRRVLLESQMKLAKAMIEYASVIAGVSV